MSESIALQRGKRAGNILLARTLVVSAVAVFQVLIDSNYSDLGRDLVFALLAGLIGIAFSFILISPLKKDKIKSILTIYLFLGVLSVLSLYITIKEDSFAGAAIALLGTAVYILVIIGIYKLGKVGKVCCYVASGLSILSVLLAVSDPEFVFLNYIDYVLLCVYYVFLGLYLESKGNDFKETTITEESPDNSNCEQTEHNGSKYDELVKLKELLDSGVITQADYDAKKKQILDL